MPEITVIHIAITATAIAIGAAIGWIMRGSRCSREKAAVNAGWQQQIEAQRAENQRLVEQNKSLMEQLSQVQASGKDATNRARELSAALKEAFQRRDELQRELKDIRGNLEIAVRQREQLQSDMKNSAARDDSVQASLKARDDKIFHLSRELENWQTRLPPLLERFRLRDEEAARLEQELEEARGRIDELESAADTSETRVEPVDSGSLGDELDASNDPTSMSQTGISDVMAHSEETAFGEPVASDDEWEIDSGTDVETGAGAEAVIASAPPAETGLESDEADTAAALDDAGEDEAVSACASESLEEAPEDQESGDAAISAVVTDLYDHDPGRLRDNLKLIKGVGPAIEKTLNELGIFRFTQIAEMSEYDIDRVAQRLKGFRSRIYREDWIGQARDLQLQKSGT